MPRYSPFTRILLATIAALWLLPRFTGIDSGLAPDARWDSGSLWSAPLWLRLWLLGVLLPAFLASLLFVRRSREARFAAGGFALSQVPTALGLLDARVGTLGLVHLVCWTPALVLLALRRPTLELATPFGLWVHAMIAVLAISLSFDARDAIALYLL